MKFTKFFVIPAPVVGLIAFAVGTHAASLEVGFQATIGSEGNALAKRENGSNSEGGPYYVSVHPNNPGYAAFAANLPGTSNPAPAFHRPFSDPVQAWSWVGGGPNNVLTQDVRTDGSGRITFTTGSTTFDGFAQDQLTLWTTSDPGPDLLNPATARDFTGPGYRGGFVDVTAAIDISGLALGTIYVFYGDFRGTPNLAVVMKDTDGAAPDITIAEAHLNGDAANRAEYYVAELEFVTDGVYDQIEYVWKGNGDGGTNGRFGGTVLTGSNAPPQTFAITDIDYAPDALPNPTVTLTWRKTGASTYSAYLSRDLSEWGEDLDDSITTDRDENPDDPDQMTVTFELTGGLASEGDLFFRIAAG